MDDGSLVKATQVRKITNINDDLESWNHLNFWKIHLSSQ